MIPKVYTSFLILENGQICQGWSFIEFSLSCGEVVFNTGMTGYQEIMTDPSYCDQIILFTYPEIGNTGINMFDAESNFSHVKGLILKNMCFHPSNWQNEISLPSYLVKYQIPHIFGLDTRYLAKQLRNIGVMTGCITGIDYDPLLVKAKIAKFKSNQAIHLVDKVTTCKSYRWLSKIPRSIYPDISYGSSVQNRLNVVVVDYGVKFNILNRLTFYGCNPIVVPARTSCSSILLLKPDGVLLSNGPGDPSLIDYAIETIQKIMKLNIPIFGICLGHQLLSLATGAKTTTLKFGHRGLNHPSGTDDVVKMTSQNHGYVVSAHTLSDDSLYVSYLNLNDQTVSGLVHNSKPCFSVQYHPEASPGPNDSDYLFAHFAAVMLSCKLK